LTLTAISGILLESAEGAFLQVGVFVGAMLLFFGYFNYRYAGSLVKAIVTAGIGLVPGCGPQIVTVTLYTQGVIPFSALAAHTISQDGDALFPILAMNPRAALWLSVTTTIPALAVGVLLYAAGR